MIVELPHAPVVITKNLHPTLRPALMVAFSPKRTAFPFGRRRVRRPAFLVCRSYWRRHLISLSFFPEVEGLSFRCRSNRSLFFLVRPRTNKSREPSPFLLPSRRAPVRSSQESSSVPFSPFSYEFQLKRSGLSFSSVVVVFYIVFFLSVPLHRNSLSSFPSLLRGVSTAQKKILFLPLSFPLERKKHLFRSLFFFSRCLLGVACDVFLDRRDQSFSLSRC